MIHLESTIKTNICDEHSSKENAVRYVYVGTLLFITTFAAVLMDS